MRRGESRLVSYIASLGQNGREAVRGNVEYCQTDLLGYCPGRVRRRVYVPSCVHRAAQGRVQILFRRIEMGDMPDGKRVRDGHGSIRTV